MTRTSVRLVLAATVAALALSGCGSEQSGTSDPASVSGARPGVGTSSSAPDPAPSAPAAGDQATDAQRDPEVPEALRFEATTVAGESFEGASVAGRPVVLWFWAPWCSVCASQVPEVTALAETYGDEVAFVGVGGLDTDEDAIAGFAADLPGLTNLSDTEGALYQRFGIAEQSSFVVLDAAGQEVLRTGYADDDELAGAVEELAG